MVTSMNETTISRISSFSRILCKFFSAVWEQDFHENKKNIDLLYNTASDKYKAFLVYYFLGKDGNKIQERLKKLL